jgi:hypothetical protein
MGVAAASEAKRRNERREDAEVGMDSSLREFIPRITGCGGVPDAFGRTGARKDWIF